MQKRFWTCAIASLGLIALILDTKTALRGAQEGLELCIRSILPALFPFCVLSKLINNTLIGKPLPFLRPVGKLCGIPEGGESILLLGLLGGYPVGAQSVSDACKSGALSLHDARRMLGFCSNAGPAFLFGILGVLFQDTRPLWSLLMIHIASAILVATILPNKSKSTCHLRDKAPLTLPAAVEESTKTMSIVCSWVILFRIILNFCQRWFLWLFDANIQVTIAGLLELSNGCISLNTVASEGLRYILGAAFLGFGGICVAMQTVSVSKDIGIGLYFPGKVMHSCISFILAWVTQYFMLPAQEQCNVTLWLPVVCILITLSIAVILRVKKKVVAFTG